MCIDVIGEFTGFTDHTIFVAVPYVPAGTDYHAHGDASSKHSIARLWVTATTFMRQNFHLYRRVQMSTAQKRSRAVSAVLAKDSIVQVVQAPEVVPVVQAPEVVPVVQAPEVVPVVQAPEVSAIDSYHSPPRIIANGGHVASPVRQSLSPSNRDKFMSKMHVQSVGCCLDIVNVSPTVRLTFRGTVVVLYPPAVNPDRRYVICMDDTGATGITVWNDNVKLFSSNKIGCMVEITKMALSMHKGQKSLALTKESQIEFLMDCPNVWWSDLMRAPPLAIMDVHSANENTILSLSGILGFLSTEEKVVRNSVVTLLIMRLVDRTGEIEVRSWNRKLSEFSHLREKPVMISRARVTAYAGTKMIELIDGPSGSVVTDSFDQAYELSVFWHAPADI
jgi:hypothetical protein